MKFNLKKTSFGLIIVLVLIYIIYGINSRDLPKSKTDFSQNASIRLFDDGVLVNTALCTPDLKLVDVEKNPTIIEVEKKSFDVCQVNYGPATHKRNLIQKLPYRCNVPWEEKSDIRLAIFSGVRVMLTDLEEYCTKN